MNKKILALSLVLLLTCVFIASVAVSTAKAQSASSGWITSYDIYDYTSNQHLAEYNAASNINQTLAPIIPAAEVRVVFTIDVFTAGEGDLKLATDLQPAIQGQYWTLSSASTYQLGSDFSAGANPASFNWVVGTFTMTLVGLVPNTQAQSAPINIITLTGPTGSVLEQASVSVTSAGMSTYLTLYAQKNSHLKTLENEGVVQGYIDLYKNVLADSQQVANSGDTTDAIAMLNSLNISDEPASATMQALFIPIVVVVAVVAVIFAFMWFRIRGRVSYFQLVVEDQIKDLEGLSLRISRIDRMASSNLESVKERLKRLVGM